MAVNVNGTPFDASSADAMGDAVADEVVDEVADEAGGSVRTQ